MEQPHVSPSATSIERLAHSIVNADEDRLYLQVLGTFGEDGTDLNRFARMYFFHFFYTIKCTLLFIYIEK